MKERLIELLRKSGASFERALPEEIADYLLDNGVVVVDSHVVSPKNLPLITHIAGYPIDEVISLMEAKKAEKALKEIQ